MKAFLFVLLLAAAGFGVYHFYLQDHPIPWLHLPSALSSTADTPAAPTAKKDFKELNTKLQGDMDHIPANLRDARQLPTRALDTKARLAPYLQLHEEYATLTQACDLIINADQAFAEHQGKCGLAPLTAGASALDRARASSGANPAVYQQQQTIWDSQRRQSDAKVRQLLATLDNKRL